MEEKNVDLIQKEQSPERRRVFTLSQNTRNVNPKIIFTENLSLSLSLSFSLSVFTSVVTGGALYHERDSKKIIAETTSRKICVSKL